jgi:signal transduction histidine kinase/PAS domain-containing protein
MSWQLNPYALFLTASALMTCMVAIYAWRRRPAPGAVPLALLALGAAEWSLGYAVATGFEDLAIRMILAKIQYPGIVSVSLGILLLVLEYTGRDRLLTPRNILWLAAVPLLTLALAWTNELHGLIWAGADVVFQNGIYTLKLQYGLFFWLHTMYDYVLLALATVLLIRFVILSPPLQRQQAITILAGALLPWLGNLMYLTKLNPFPQLDLTPFAYSLSGLVILWGLFRYHLLDIVPIARDRALDSMREGLLVLDARDRIVDINSAMRSIAQVSTSQAIGCPVGEVFSVWPSFVARIHDDAGAEAGIFLVRDTGERYYDLSVSPLTNWRGRLTGRLVVLYDVTKRRQAEQALHDHTDRLETMREIDQSILAARSAETIALAVSSRVRYLVPCQRVIVTEVTETRQLEKLAIESSAGSIPEVDIDAYHEILEDASVRQGWVKGIEDLADVAHRTPMQEALYAEGVRSYVLVPLFIQDELIGTLHLESVHPNNFAADHVNAAVEVAVLLAVGIRQARLYERAQRELDERKRAEEALHQRTAELEAQNAELDAFSHTVAHDLKNPLGAITGFADLLVEFAEERREISKEKSVLIAKQIVEGAEIMENIIESLMLLAGVRQQQVILEPLDMESTMAQVERSLTSLIDRYGAELELPSSWPTALGYGPWVREVWINYISNAIKYGGRPPRVEVGAMADGNGSVRFWVRDNGHGLSAEEQELLFAPFERLSQVRVQGHGLGLSIVRRIVDKLGGKVGVESEIEKGSEFWFSLRAQ